MTGRVPAIVGLVAAVLAAGAAACGERGERAVRSARPVLDGELPVPIGRVTLDPPPRIVFTQFAPSEAEARDAAERIVAFIERRSGLRMEADVAASYEDVEARIVDGRDDFAFVTPLVYVRVADRFARERSLRGRVALRLVLNSVAAGSPTYLGYVVAADDTRVTSLRDLPGTRFGMIEGSASGYLYPMDLVASRGLDVEAAFAGVRFFSSHSDLHRELLRPASERSVDAGALYDHIVERAGGGREGLRVIGKTARIPRDALVVRVPLDGGREDGRMRVAAAAVQHALLALESYPEIADRVRDLLGFDGWIIGGDWRYDGIREVYRRFGHYRLGTAVGDGEAGAQ